MEPADPAAKVRQFSPTGDEDADIAALYDLLDQLGDAQHDPDVRRELISIFERHPGADLGSPGPIVHALEKSPIDEHVDLLAESLQRRATIMTIWMAQRCFRSKLSEINRAKLLESLATAQRQQTPTGEVAMMLAETLQKYGT